MAYTPLWKQKEIVDGWVDRLKAGEHWRDLAGIRASELTIKKGLAYFGYSTRLVDYGYNPWPKRTDYPVEDFISRLRNGDTLKSLGDEYGITRERVRQLVFAHDPHTMEKIKAERREVTQRQQAEKEAARWKPAVCVVCERPFETKEANIRCCSVQCSQAWTWARWLLDPKYRIRIFRANGPARRRESADPARSKIAIDRWKKNRLTNLGTYDETSAAFQLIVKACGSKKAAHERVMKTMRQTRAIYRKEMQ